MAMTLGGTITELQKRMSIAEVRVWMAYRQKYGPMNHVRMFDRPAALIGSILSNAHGGKAKMAELMPFGQEEKVATLDDVVASFGPGVKIGKRG